MITLPDSPRTLNMIPAPFRMSRFSLIISGGFRIINSVLDGCETVIRIIPADFSHDSQAAFYRTVFETVSLWNP